MKQFIISCLAFLAMETAQAQIQNPIRWTYNANPIGNNMYLVHLTAHLDPGWHIYSQVQPKEAVCVPTKIVFADKPHVALLGKTKEVGKKEKYEDTQAEIIQYQYAGKVDFVQTLSLKDKDLASVSGNITYQTCKDGECLPPKTVAFQVMLK